jgi:hypothetical protein
MLTREKRHRTNTTSTLSVSEPPDDTMDCKTLAESAISRLIVVGHHGLKAIQCEYREGKLTLSGVVSSFFQKQLAQHAAFKAYTETKIPTAIDVVPIWNLIQVESDDSVSK